MCNANVEIIPHRWVEREKLPFALFGVDRRCRNFEGLKKWNGANGLLDIREEWHRLEREEGEYVWSEYGSRTTTKRSGIRENFYGS